MKHPRTQDRREELLRAAREIFAEKGFEAATVSEIVARAGVAQGTFYLYFPSKFSVVKDLTHEMQGRIEQAVRLSSAEAADLGEMIDRSVETSFRILGEYRDVLALPSVSQRWLVGGENNISFFTPYHILIAETICNAQAAGTVSPAIDAQVTAMLIIGMIYYAANQCYVYRSAISAETYIKEAAGFIRRALGIV